MSWHRLGDTAFSSGAESEAIDIQIARPIVRLAVVLDGEQTSGTSGTLVELSTQNLLRQLRLTKGGQPIQTMGDASQLASAGRLMDVVNRTWLRAVPHFGPAATSGTNRLRHSFMVPISVPQELYPVDLVDRTALRIPGDNWRWRTRWGVLADLVTGGSGYAITGASTGLELYAEVNDGLSEDYPDESFLLRTVPDVQTIPAAAATQRRFRLNRNGEVAFHALLAIDNSLVSDTMITELQYLLDNEDIRAQASWFAAQHLAEANGDAPGNLPVGDAGIDFDSFHDFLNLVDASGAEGWDVNVSHAATTGVAQLAQQTYYLSPREG